MPNSVHTDGGMSAAPIAVTPNDAALRASLLDAGFAFVEGSTLRALLPASLGQDFKTFAESWDRLGDDRYMADGGRYRRRRHAAFAVGPDGIVRKPHQPHYQSRDYNPLNGGIARLFEPIESGVANGPTLTSIIDFADRLFTPLSGRSMVDWHVETHQFRIEAASDMTGLPTPEGLHRDGVDWVLVMLIRRQNVVQGVTKIHGLDGREIGSFCLANAFDAALVDDHKVYHAVTPVVPDDPSVPAFRDVLVVTFKAD